MERALTVRISSIALLEKNSFLRSWVNVPRAARPAFHSAQRRTAGRGRIPSPRRACVPSPPTRGQIADFPRRDFPETFSMAEIFTRGDRVRFLRQKGAAHDSARFESAVPQCP